MEEILTESILERRGCFLEEKNNLVSLFRLRCQERICSLEGPYIKFSLLKRNI